MRSVLVGLVLIAAVLAGLWLGAESWAARRLAQQIAAHPDLSAQSVRPLRQPDRIGLRLLAVAWSTGPGPGGAGAAVPAGDGPATEGVATDGVAGSGPALDLPALDLWVRPWSPLHGTAVLPDRARLRLNGRDRTLELQDSTAEIRLGASNGLAVAQIGLRSGPVRMDSAPLLGRADLHAQMSALDFDAPKPARAAYRVRVDVADLQPDRLADLGFAPSALRGAASVQGQAQVWTDGVPRAGAPAPRLVGFQSQRLALRIGPIAAHLTGRITRDAQGRAEGVVAIYTSDAAELIAALAEAGVIPDDAVMLATAMLRQVGSQAMPDLDPDRPVAKASAVAAPPPSLTFPEPAEGELRLPLILSGGQMMLGIIPLGAAPRIF